MFYGADNEKTAFVETFEPSAKKEKAMSFATFRSTRPLRLLDLARIPSIPSLFDETRYDDRMSLIFLHGFKRDAVKPVVRDGSEHYEYVPTQIVAEFFRHVFALRGGNRLDGIRFQSSRPGGTICYSLFLGADDCCDPPAPFDKILWLESNRTCRINFKTGSFK